MIVVMRETTKMKNIAWWQYGLMIGLFATLIDIPIDLMFDKAVTFSSVASFFSATAIGSSIGAAIVQRHKSDRK